MTLEKWIKNCPKCNREMLYSEKWCYNKSIKNNTFCVRCCKIGKVFTEEHKKKLAKSHIGKLISEGTRKKLQENHSHFWLGKIGKNNPTFGKIRSEKSKLKMSISKLGVKNNNYGKCFSEETKKKHRISVLERLERLGISPHEDIGAKKYFDEINKKGFNFIPKRFIEIGYEADGYDCNKHIWCEFDTPYHQRIGQQKKDQVRQQNIIEYFEKSGNPLTMFIRVQADKNGKILNIKYVYESKNKGYLCGDMM